ncbi:NYN domain-containing protein [[Ruminococcus] lactaris]|uniref:NYN domain-containing protein n=1 Tax=[Ruminococcus] lactaris TaxID=46228 RepID=UPI0035661C73
MSGQERKTGKRVLNVGLLAHVDAGKTTLSESILYQSGAIRNLGRVDHQDAFLDTDEMERERGITIFSKQAVLAWKDTGITLLDTPGHVDFSAEMERVLQVLDCAVLVISGADGVQGHTETLWKLLTRYGIPVFLFVNKMDQEGTDCGKLLAELKSRFSEGCIDFGRVETGAEEVIEEIAVCDEQTMEEYLEKGSVAAASIRRLVAERKIFPCYFGSALHLQGVEELMNGICTYQMQKEYPAVFGAKVYKIARDGQGNRLTYLKVTGGTLKVKDVIGENGDKVNQIRVYSGEKYELLSEADAGKVCAVTGLAETYPGQGLGAEKDSELPILEPVLTYRIILPDDCNVHTMLRDLKLLEEEEPELHVVWIEKSQEIHVQLMGDVQIEILQRIIKERFGVLVEFGEGSIVYKETIAAPVEGVGHFEPLRHYAEVHLRLEPGERGSGMQFDSECSEDVLDRNWQRLVLTHLEEKEHKGVLTGSVITDMKITLTSGKAHLKHTEGGDFRQATYRAVRQGLKKAESVLLEPYYEFRIELPSENVGRAMTDIQNRFGKFEAPETLGEMTVLTGIAPVSTLSGYQKDVIAYTGGRGRISLTLKGYDLCHNQEEVVAARGYDSELDLANPTGSVFCAHGAGFVVDWDEVEEYMHMERTLDQTGEEGLAEVTLPKRRHSSIELTQEELDAIYVRTPDPVTVCAKEKDREPGSAYTDPKWERRRREKEGRQEYLLVDGYNIIFSWEELRELSEKDIGAARGKLADILSNYQGYRKCTLILVYDAYKVEGNPGEVMKYHNIYIVYTKEAETADQYIEKTVRRIAKDAAVTVATSDGLEQVIILGQGANRMSAPGLKEEIERTLAEVRGEHLGKKGSVGNYLFDYLDEETAEEMEKVRLGKAGKNGRDKK